MVPLRDYFHRGAMQNSVMWQTYCKGCVENYLQTVGATAFERTQGSEVWLADSQLFLAYAAVGSTRVKSQHGLLISWGRNLIRNPMPTQNCFLNAEQGSTVEPHVLHRSTWLYGSTALRTMASLIEGDGYCSTALLGSTWLSVAMGCFPDVVDVKGNSTSTCLVAKTSADQADQSIPGVANPFHLAHFVDDKHAIFQNLEDEFPCSVGDVEMMDSEEPLNVYEHGFSPKGNRPRKKTTSLSSFAEKNLKMSSNKTNPNVNNIPTGGVPQGAPLTSVNYLSALTGGGEKEGGHRERQLTEESLDKTVPTKFRNRKFATLYMEAHIDVEKFHARTGVPPPPGLFKSKKRIWTENSSISLGSSVLKRTRLASAGPHSLKSSFALASLASTATSVTLFFAEHTSDPETGVQSFNWCTDDPTAHPAMLENNSFGKGRSKLVFKASYFL
ncbi:hypothetical protein B0H10DRAFT_1962865 [Mycena sp. CBHHK59/15]|nr:hypothetical protein B0H10DRAFT_1962865 [Mycena sp. CBHHK59/15]